MDGNLENAFFKLIYEIDDPFARIDYITPIKTKAEFGQFSGPPPSQEMSAEETLFPDTEKKDENKLKKDEEKKKEGD